MEMRTLQELTNLVDWCSTARVGTVVWSFVLPTFNLDMTTQKFSKGHIDLSDYERYLLTTGELPNRLKTWGAVSTHVVETDYELARCLDTLAEAARRERASAYHRPPTKFLACDKEVERLRFKMLNDGATRREFDRAVDQLEKKREKVKRALKRARMQGKEERVQNDLYGNLIRKLSNSLDSNRYWLPSVLDSLVERGRYRRAWIFDWQIEKYPTTSKTEAERAVWLKAQSAKKEIRARRTLAHERNLEKKKRLSFFHDCTKPKRRLKHLFVIDNHRIIKNDRYDCCQRSAILDAWLDIKDIQNYVSCKCKENKYDLCFCKYKCECKCKEKYHAQMESAHGEEDSSSIQKAGNVVLEDQRDVSLAQSFPAGVDSYTCYAAPESQDSLEDRWLTIWNGSWTASQTTDVIIKELNLPADVLSNFPNSPNIMKFKQHVYWKGDMRVQIVVNSNLRQYGQLQARFYYGSEFERDFDKYRNNIWVGSQQSHCLISANSSNIGELFIPFEFFRPYLFIGDVQNKNIAFLGKLILAVIIPLTVKSGTEPSCRISIRIKFENNEFKGPVDRAMKAQGPLMNSLLSHVPAGPEVAQSLKAIMNLDKPPSIQTGEVMLPQNVGSWCAGKDQADWVVPLRLAPTKMLPYGKGRIPPINEMSVNHLTSIFGMVKLLEWKPEFHSGTELWSFDASPCWDFGDYPSKLVDTRNCCVMPPVSVIANCFMYWRGSLRLRIDVVGAADLSGRLVAVYCPRISSSFRLDLVNMFSFPHAIFDLQEKRQFTFEIPFLADRMFWQRRESIDRDHKACIPPGRVFLFVYNDLISNLTIPSDCKLVCYLAGGPDFEVAIPCCPNFGLSFNTTVWLNDKVEKVISFKNKYYPAYTGSWRGFGASRKYILRYGEVSDHVAQLDTNIPEVEAVAKVFVPLENYYCPMTLKDGTRTKVVNAKYFVPWVTEVGSKGPMYLIPFSTKDKAENFILNQMDPSGAEDFVETAAVYNTPSQMTFVYADLRVQKSEKAPYIYHGQMDERNSVLDPLAPMAKVCSTGFGQNILGESFHDLKDVCCRFQRYACGTKEIEPDKFKNFDVITVKFPVYPQGLELDIGTHKNINEYWNRTRDGLIPVIASGYRFFTGGLRFRIMVTTYDATGNMIPSKLSVQHRPGHGSDFASVEFCNPNWLTSSDLELPGYAFHIQNELVNNIISIEVPFYMPSIRGLLQRPKNFSNSSLIHSLGEVFLTVNPVGSAIFSFDYEIYYAFADDMRFSLFQGFPPVFNITDIPDYRKTSSQNDRRSNEIPRDAPPDFPPPPPLPPPRAPPVGPGEPEVEIFDDERVQWQRVRVKRKLPELDVPQIKEMLEIFKISKMGILAAAQCESVEFDFACFIQFCKYAESQDLQIMFFFLKGTLIDREYIINFEFSRRRGKSALITELSRHFPDLYREFFIWKFDDPEEMSNPPKFVAQMPQVSEILFPGMAEAMTKVNNIDFEKINECIGNSSESSLNVKELTQSLNEGISKIKEYFNSEIVSQSQAHNKLDDYVSHFMSIVINSSSFMFNPCVSTFVSAIMNVFLNFQVFSVSFFSSIYSALTEYMFKKFPEANEPHEAYHGQSEADEDSALAGYLSTLIAGVAGTFNFIHSITRDQKRSLAKILLQDLKDFSLTANHLFIFCKNNIQAIKKACEYFWITQPSNVTIAFFQEFDNDIFEWAKEVMSLTSGENADLIFSNIIKASRVYDCANQACLIQCKLLELKKEDRAKLTAERIAVLNKLSKDIIQLRDKLARSHIAPPVKFEPFVIHFYGKPGIGKSFIGQELPYDLLEAIGFKTYNEVTFVRTPGVAYWNGLSHQPVVIYDDWYQCNSPEFGGVQVAELLQLKTRAIFNPPMAAVEDKNIRYNPLIVMLVSNNGFPKYEGVAETTALWRRVDCLVHVRKRNDYRAIKTTDIDEDVLKNKGHLEFHIHEDSLNEKFQVSNHYHVEYDTFKVNLIAEFKKYYKRELGHYSNAIRRITRLFPRDGEECFRLPQSKFWTSTEEYMEYVGQEDQHRAERAEEVIRSYWATKFLNFKEAVKYMFGFKNKYQPNVGGEETVPKGIMVSPEMYEAFLKFQQDNMENCEPSELEPDNPKLCAHNLLVHNRDLCGDLEWDTEFKMWRASVLVNDINWPTIYEIVDACNDKQKLIETLRVSENDEIDDLVETVPYPKIIQFLNIVLDEIPISGDRTIPVIPWVIELNFKHVAGMYYYYRKSKVIYCVVDNVIFVAHDKCNSPHCILKEKAMRNRFVVEYIDWSVVLTHLRNRGEPLVDLVPQEYLDLNSGAQVFYECSDEEIQGKVGWLKGVWSKISDVFKNLNVNTFYVWVQRILCILTLVMPFILTYYGLRNFKRSFDNTCQRIEDGEFIGRCGQGFGSGDATVRGGHKSSPRQLGRTALVNYKGQLSPEEVISVNKLIKRNTFFLMALEPETNKYRSTRCVGVFGNVAICPTHYFDFFNSVPDWQFYYISAINPTALRIKLEEIKLYEYSNSSLCAFSLPKRFPLFKDLTSKIATEQDHSKINHVGSILEICKPSEFSIDCQEYIHQVVSSDIVGIDVEGSNDYRPFEVKEGYSYDYFTGEGRCGSLLQSSNLVSCIIGMHVAGSSVEGISDILTREMVIMAKEKFGDSPDIDEPYVGNMHRPVALPDCEVLTLGTVPSKLAHRESEKSRIVPSLVQLYSDKVEFPVRKEPAVLSPRDPRLEEPFSPMVEGVKYHGMPLDEFREDHLKIAAKDLENLYLTNCKPCRSKVGVLSILDACSGFVGLENYDHLEWRTSEGFPFVKERPAGAHDKKWLFEFDELANRVISVNPKLLNLIREQQDQRMQNIVPFTVFTDCLKDTTVDKDKVLLPGKTRIFSMAPVNLTIPLRQYTLDFSAAMMKNRLQLEHAVGINPDSYEWTELAFKLSAVGNSVVTGDYSKFGDTIPFQIIQNFMMLINKWYAKNSNSWKEEDDQIRNIFSEEIGHAVHLMFNVLYRCVCGQPSGNPLTVLINSYANSTYIRLAWLSIMEFTAYADLKCFHENVRCFSYGDDIILGVSDLVKEKFNAESLCLFFKSYKLKFTNADKSDTIVKWTPLGKADFLKRGFVMHPYRRKFPTVIMAPLSVESIEDTVNWIWNSGYGFTDERCPEFVSMCKQVCEDATRNAFTRGPLYYENFCSKLTKFWQSRGEFVCYPTWQQLDFKIYDLNQQLTVYTGAVGVVS